MLPLTKFGWLLMDFMMAWDTYTYTRKKERPNNILFWLCENGQHVIAWMAFMQAIALLDFLSCFICYIRASRCSTKFGLNTLFCCFSAVHINMYRIEGSLSSLFLFFYYRLWSTWKHLRTTETAASSKICKVIKNTKEWKKREIVWNNENNGTG